jgi:hypothetical protein
VIQISAMPTPRSPPTSACELDTGIPSSHVATFHKRAARSGLRISATSSRVFRLARRLTGRRWMKANATAVPPRNTPRKFQIPDQTTARGAFLDRV